MKKLLSSILILFNLFQYTLFAEPKTPEYKGIYMTSWVAGTQYYYDLMEKVNSSDINSIMIDVKDASGGVFYDSNLAIVDSVGSKEIRISNNKLEKIIQQCKKDTIHLVARLVVAKDPMLAKYLDHKFAIQDKKTNENTIWTDLFSEEVRNYNIQIAKEVASLGFDEINFDYIRFPDRADVSQPVYPFRESFPNGPKLYNAIDKFLIDADDQLDCRISVDVFGFTVFNSLETHMNESYNLTGQVIEIMALHVDVIMPMLYPSHFDERTHRDIAIIYPNHPTEYGIVLRGVQNAIKRVNGNAEIIPWIQGFDWKVEDFDEYYVFQQLIATSDAGINSFYIWNPRNKYVETWKALEIYDNINNK